MHQEEKEEDEDRTLKNIIDMISKMNYQYKIQSNSSPNKITVRNKCYAGTETSP